MNNEEGYDVLILDVDMGEISGLDIASILYEQHSDVLIIFLSAYSNYVYEAIKYDGTYIIQLENAIKTFTTK